MLPKVTIVIPSYNRHRQLNRLLEYYSHYRIPIIVADSTKSVFPNRNKYENVKYYHYPNLPYAHKLPLIYKKVKTKFVLFCADDDFVIPSAIKECVQFLEKNSDYNSAHGHYIFFEDKKTDIVAYPFYLSVVDLDINASEPLERVRQILSNYMQLLYAVTKTSDIKNVFKSLSENPGIKNDSLVELFQAVALCINGKSKTLPVFYCAREVTPNSARTRVPGLDVVSTSKKYLAQYHLWIKVILKLLLKKEKMPEKLAREGLMEAIKSYLKNELITIPFLNINIYSLQLQRSLNKYSFGLAQKIYRLLLPSPDVKNIQNHGFSKVKGRTEFKIIKDFIERYRAV